MYIWKEENLKDFVNYLKCLRNNWSNFTIEHL